MAGQDMPNDVPPDDEATSRPSVVADAVTDLALMSIPEVLLWLVSLPFRLLAWLIGGLLSALG